MLRTAEVWQQVGNATRSLPTAGNGGGAVLPSLSPLQDFGVRFAKNLSTFAALKTHVRPTLTRASEEWRVTSGLCPHPARL